MKKKLSTLFVILVSLGLLISACAAPATTTSTANAPQTPTLVPWAAHATALPAPSPTPRPSPKFVFFGNPNVITQNPADVVLWAEKGYQDPPKVEFNGQSCSPVAWYDWDGREQLEKDFDRTKGHIYVTWRDSNRVVLETELDPYARFGHLWKCDRLDLMVKFIKSYSYERERQGLNVEVLGSPIVPPAPLCTYDPNSAEFLVGKRVKIVDFGETWTAFEYVGQVYCIPLRSIADREHQYLGYRGRFVHPTDLLSYQTFRFDQLHGPYPTGTEGTFEKEDNAFAPYLVRVDSVVGPHDADLTRVFSSNEYQDKLKAHIKDQIPVDWEQFSKPGAIDIETMCIVMIRFDYAVPSPLSYCSRATQADMANIRWNSSINPPVGDDVDGWVQIIPTDDERLNAKRLSVTACYFAPNADFRKYTPYVITSTWRGILAFSTPMPYVKDRYNIIYALICSDGWKEVK